MSTDDPEILFDRRGAAGVITLNRPQALNAVTHGMVRALASQLSQWADDPAIAHVVVTGNGGRAFSAGGDIRAVHDLGRAGRQAEALPFWREEYVLNAMIKRYPKPYIALIDGIVMGGGVGISVHGSHRVAGDNLLFAMPEVGIGFFPDVGGTWFLPRMPGEMGTYCALTGDRLKAGDALATGIATHYVASSRFPELIEALTGKVPIDAILSAFSTKLDGGPVMNRRGAIDRLFTGDRVETILDALDAEAETESHDADWARMSAKTIRAKSPTSLKLALAQVRRGREWTFDECMRAEFRIVSRVIYDQDFYEGVRAAIIDKDNAPHWRPEKLADVSDADIERHFAPLADELELP
ncbi:MAG TPA: enoyl-CoA hydratase/isomerase family protein [Xanthobacteraceae bacterium]|nr:enoyl-CoA hydratase/isomerase family protein [Xanthobacteraceae bacterium]